MMSGPKLPRERSTEVRLMKAASQGNIFGNMLRLATLKKSGHPRAFAASKALLKPDSSETYLSSELDLIENL